MGVCNEAQQMFLSAKKDLLALQGMINPEVFAEEIFGCHAQ